MAQKARWRAQFDTLWNGGAVSTAGNVVFQGAGDGWFSAYDARTGTRLWHQNVGMGTIASPMTYSEPWSKVTAGIEGTSEMKSSACIRRYDTGLS